MKKISCDLRLGKKTTIRFADFLYYFYRKREKKKENDNWKMT